MKAFLMLEDGTRFYGEPFGDVQNTVGEVVFSTSMTGYQEGLTDPSFYGQILVLTYPLIGNVGFNNFDYESHRISVKGLVVKELCEAPSNWATKGSLDEFMKKFNIVGLKGVDTRALTLKIREESVMRGMICLQEPTAEQIEELKSYKIEKPVHRVTVKEKKKYDGQKSGKNIAVMDFGVKENMIRELHKRGHNLTIYPATTAAEEILADNPDGILLSNGPGDPKDNDDIIANIKKLIGKKPIMGICMGHQLLALANGLDSYKLKYGHRGANQPVKDLNTGRVYISSQNHGYAICEPKGSKDIEVTFRNVNDGTVVGLKYKKHKSFSVQFHPEACPGPMDTQFLFDDFERLMEEDTNAQK
jgi:carbamoyl-phosphate synthase small subunit